MGAVTCIIHANKEWKAYRFKDLLLLLGRQGRVQGEYLDGPNLQPQGRKGQSQDRLLRHHEIKGLLCSSSGMQLTSHDALQCKQLLVDVPRQQFARHIAFMSTTAMPSLMTAVQI